MRTSATPIDDEIIVCGVCRKRTRIPNEVGTRGLRCRICRNDIATPAIVQRLENIRGSISELTLQYRFFALRGNREISVKLRREESLLGVVSTYIGFPSTVRARPDLIVDIEVCGDQLREKLERDLMSTAVRALETVIRILRVAHTPKALTSGK